MSASWEVLRSRILTRIAIANGGCWEWQGSIDCDGYGRMAFRGKNVRAMRVSWSAAHNVDWPEGMCCLHACDNRRCVNPDHVRPGTVAENNQEAWDRGARKRGRQENLTHCRWGHPVPPENRVTYPSLNGSWRCKTCAQSQWTAANAKRKASR